MSIKLLNWGLFTGKYWGVMGLMLLAISLLGCGRAAAPKIVVPEDHFEFGEVFEGQLSHTFVNKNSGSTPLEIRKVDPDCACTVANYNRSIPPGGQGEISLSLKLSIKPYSVMRPFRKETRVFVNDPERSEFSLVLTGKAKPFIEIEPSHIVRFRGAPGDNLHGEVRFTSHLPGSFEITNFRTNIPDKIDMNLKPVEPGRVYVLEVKNKAQNSDNYGGIIEISTTSKERPRLMVRVFGQIFLPSAGCQ